MEIVRDKKTVRIGRIIFLLSISFLMAACQFACAQEMSIERHVSYNKFYKKQMVSKFPSYGIDVVNGTDTTYLSILADSISPKQFGIRLYAYFSKSTDLSNSMIKIWFSDGSDNYLVFNSIDQNLGYVEYDLTDEVYAKMLRTGIKGVSFSMLSKKIPIEDEYYFSAFLNRHYR